ncbi:MAG: PE-PGRS family protein [Solirubrobacteraceae bacterium]
MRGAGAPAVLAAASALLAAVVAGCGGSGAARSSPPPAPRSTAAGPAAPRPPALCGALRARVTGRVGDPSANELSGLVRSRAQAGLLWSHDDSGAGPVLFGLRADGRVAARPIVTGAQAVDWEDIAAGPGPDGRPLLYVGDIGDNATRRASVDVYRVAEPRAGAGATAPAARLRLRYPDAAHDAEALLVDPLRDDLVIVTKGLGVARAYLASARLPAGSQATLRRGPAIALSLVTAGDVSADGRIVVLRGYDRLAVWVRHGRERLTTTLRRAPCLSPTSLAGEGQGEAIALDHRGTSFTTVAEGSPAVLRRYTVRR